MTNSLKMQLWWNDSTNDSKNDVLSQFDFSDITNDVAEFFSLDWDSLPYIIKRTLVHHAEVPIEYS